MPNPKTNTVTENVVSAIENIKGGQVSYRADSFGIVHGVIGKRSFTEEKLLENLVAYVDQIKKTKAASVKGEYIKSISLSSTMSPSVKININSFN